MAAETPDQADLLYGAAAIGGYLGFTASIVRHHVYQGRLPAFKLGGRLCARRSALNGWIAEQEAAARAKPEG